MMQRSRTLYSFLFLRIAALFLIGTAVSGAQSRGDQACDPSRHFLNVLEVEGRYINDHCLIQDREGMWHLFCIIGEISGREWFRDGNETEIGHFTSRDLLTWNEHPAAIAIGPPGSVDAGHVYAPYVFEKDSLYYMFYTATAAKHFSAERICLATSRDLVTWTKSDRNPVFVPDPDRVPYYREDYVGGAGPVSCRDPHIIRTSPSGYTMYYVTRLKPDTSGEELGCVAAATSTDLVNWTDAGPVLTRTVRGLERNGYGHPESPCVVSNEGAYYLFWKSGDGMHYAASVNPLDYRYSDSYFLATSHASEVVRKGADWYITSCSRPPDDILHREDRTKGLYVAALEWKDKRPIILPIEAVDSTRGENR